MKTANHNDSSKPITKRASVLAVLALLLATVFAPAAQAQSQTRLIVRDSLGLNHLNLLCLLLRCNVQYGLGDPQGQLFLVTVPLSFNLLRLDLNLGIVDIELDQKVRTAGAAAGPAPSYLSDKNPVNYYGSTVWHGYLAQPAYSIIGADKAQSAYGSTGSGVTVAVIDTGADTTHPALQGVLVSGYDFTRNTSGGSEKHDVSASPNMNNAEPGQVNQSTVALLDQSTVALLDGNGSYAAFGHGTMTAGLVHLVAPQAKIMPLKAFGPDGTGYASDVMRAIYYGVKNGADVLSMSFSFTTSSSELANAISYAQKQGVICVAAAGNDGQKVAVYPAALPGVIDVASTNNYDVQSSFTNYGAPPVDLAAPGEAIMSPYPYGTYAAAWGTSFSTPLVAGTAAAMLGKNGACSSSAVPNGLVKSAAWISNANLNNLRVDAYQSIQACH
ncbi:MAG: S8 family peptidase [Terriglobales bacterium]